MSHGTDSASLSRRAPVATIVDVAQSDIADPVGARQPRHPGDLEPLDALTFADGIEVRRRAGTGPVSETTWYAFEAKPVALPTGDAAGSATARKSVSRRGSRAERSTGAAAAPRRAFERQAKHLARPRALRAAGGAVA